MELPGLLVKLRIGVCVITETHLRYHDVSRINFGSYEIVAKYCREVEGRIGGGVMILVRKQFKADIAEIVKTELEGLELCSIKLYVSSSESMTMLFTGLYIPPRITPDLTAGNLESISRPQINSKTRDKYSHLLTGDLNTTSWSELYEEWTQEEGLWALNDPTVSTINKGSTVDKCLFIPGNYIPTTFLTLEEGGLLEISELKRETYPAVVLPELAIGDPYPILLPIPCDIEQEVLTDRKLRLEDFTEKDWIQ